MDQKRDFRHYLVTYCKSVDIVIRNLNIRGFQGCIFSNKSRIQFLALKGTQMAFFSFVWWKNRLKMMSNIILIWKVCAVISDANLDLYENHKTSYLFPWFWQASFVIFSLKMDKKLIKSWLTCSKCCIFVVSWIAQN